MENSKNLSIDVVVNYHDGVIERDDQCFKLDPRQVQLIEFFLAHPDQNITRQTLSEDVWQSAYTSDDTINKTISSLRKALANQRDLFITTIPKVGYRFSVAEHVSLKIRHSPQVKIEPSVTKPSILSSSETPPETQKTTLDETSLNLPDNKSDSTPVKGWLNATVVMVAIVALGVTFGIGYWFSMSPGQWPNSAIAEPSSSQGANQRSTQGKSLKQLSTQGNAPVLLAVANIELAATDIVSTAFTEVLREQILNDLSMVKGFSIVDSTLDSKQQQAQAAKASVVLKSKLLLFDETGDKAGEKTVKLTLQLIDSASGARVFSTMIDTTMTNKQTLLAHLGKQVVAAVKLALMQPKLFKRYAPALKQLSHVEVEQLILASNHLQRTLPKALEKALDILETINKNKPDTPEVLGLLAIAHAQVKSRISGQYESSTHQIRVFAEQALALNPSNFDALKALSSYYINTTHLKNKANHVLNALLRYHPGEPAAWRFRLYSMVLGARSCGDIRIFVNSIPAGLFKPLRLKVIEQILDTCGVTQPSMQVEQLWQQRKMDSNGKTQKALPSNLSLFYRVNDFMAEIQQSRLNVRPGPKLTLQMYEIKLAMGDIKGAHIIAEDLKRTATDYWLRSANHIAQVYNQPALHDLPPITVQDYSLLDNLTNLYMVANLVKNTGQADRQDQAQTALQAYLEHLPEFEPALNTRTQSIALMMAQRAGGKIEDSQQTASRLSRQLLRYRNNSPESYFFWNLGKLQLISDFYCGVACQPSGLAQLFEPSHRWWTDDIGFLRIALEPWAKTPLVKEYFDKMEQDRLRVRSRLGI
ncbi:MAG: DNA-binding winged helix-turn-helix (wHTH) protein/TolB-like protein [Phenylobacterium sp.]